MDEARDAVERIRDALNAHDLAALVSCFAEDYENSWPAHPARGFRGSEQVRSNWQQIFSFVPDFHADVVSSLCDSSVAFTEWEFTGTRRDGMQHHMRGTTILGADGGLVRWSRFYMEPVDESAVTVNEAVRRQVVGQ